MDVLPILHMKMVPYMARLPDEDHEWKMTRSERRQVAVLRTLVPWTRDRVAVVMRHTRVGTALSFASLSLAEGGSLWMHAPGWLIPLMFIPSLVLALGISIVPSFFSTFCWVERIALMAGRFDGLLGEMAEKMQDMGRADAYAPARFASRFLDERGACDTLAAIRLTEVMTRLLHKKQSSYNMDGDIRELVARIMEDATEKPNKINYMSIK